MSDVNTLAVFLDTNILLHYPPLKDVDWRAVCNAGQVRLVLCMQVIHELDQKKDDARLSRRAGARIREIKGLLSPPGNVREGVTLEVFPYEVRLTDFPHTLSPDSKDDRIVHSVQKFQGSNVGVPVAVCTEDMGMLLRCQAHNMTVIEPDKASRLDDPLSEVERKNKTLAAELASLRAKVPDLLFRVCKAAEQNCEAEGPFVVECRRIAIEDKVDTEVEKERSRLRVPRRDRRAGTVLALGVVPEEDYVRYEKDIEAYLARYAQWLEARDRLRAVAPLFFEFTFIVANKGRCPASDVEVDIRFPPRLASLQYEDEGAGEIMTVPRKPEPPEKPWSSLDKLRNLDVSSLMPRQPSFEMPTIRHRDEPSASVDGSREDGLHLLLRVPNLNHHRQVSFEKLFARIRSWDDAVPFEAELTATASNIPDRIERRIPFIVRVLP